MNDQAYIRD